MEKRDILWIDYAKFIGIILVILGHTMTLFGQNMNDNIANCYINMFHMPLFFILSGYLYKIKSKKENNDKIIKGLLIPYIAYQLFYFPFLVLKHILYFHSDPILILKKALIGLFLGANVPEPSFFINICGPCWFILVIIQLRLIFNYINMSSKNLSIITLCSIALLKILSIYQIDLYFCLDNLLMAIPYFILGYCIKIRCSDIIEGLKNYKKIIAIAICSVIVYVIMKINGAVVIADLITSLKPKTSLLMAFLSGIMGTIMICLISTYFKQRPNFVKTISRNTLFIIFFHFFIIFIESSIHIKNILRGLYLKSNIYLYVSNELFLKMCIIILFTILSLILNYLVIRVLEKYHPWILGKYNDK